VNVLDADLTLADGRACINDVGDTRAAAVGEHIRQVAVGRERVELLA